MSFFFQEMLNLVKWKRDAKREIKTLSVGKSLKTLNGLKFYENDEGMPVNLGSGSFGSVFVAVYKGQLVALKVIILVLYTIFIKFYA